MAEEFVTVLFEDGTPGQAPASEVVRTTGRDENDNEIVDWVEYRFPRSPDHVAHRSVHLTLKKWPDGLGGVAAQLG